MEYADKIAAKIDSLIKQTKTRRTKLGEVLGANPKASAQWKYIKFANFYSSIKKAKINVSNLAKIAAHFGKSIEWFLSDQKESGIIPLESRNVCVVPLMGKVSEIKKNYDKSKATGWLAYPFRNPDGKCQIFALTAEDDCMTPQIKKGDIVFLDPQVKGETSGEVAVVKTGYKAPVLRRLLKRDDGKIELKCDNPNEGGMIVNPESLQIFGIVKHKLTAI